MALGLQRETTMDIGKRLSSFEMCDKWSMVMECTIVIFLRTSVCVVIEFVLVYVPQDNVTLTSNTNCTER